MRSEPSNVSKASHMKRVSLCLNDNQGFVFSALISESSGLIWCIVGRIEQSNLAINILPLQQLLLDYPAASFREIRISDYLR